jgi:serine/threonine protein kinase
MENQIVQNHVAAGDVLAGKYRVERPLGMGGMGVVVAATHLDLREERAIKLMRPDLNHPQIVERFLREARAVVKLRSEHVAQVYDIGRLATGAPFIVMELLHGEDLAAVLKKRGTLPVDEAVLYVMQACDALSEAHGRGIVHRDLKPANLFLTHREDGSPCIKVLDFGVSKHIQQDGEATELEMTSNGDIMGSPLYMAPEQMRAAREVDARADIWALGAILYKLLTGRAPFQKATTPEICMAVLGDEIAAPPSSLRKGIPSGFEAVIMRCLQKVVESRFARAADLKAALSPYLEPREGYRDEQPSLVDEPRSSRTSNSSRPIPRNIDAILLGCIGQDSGRNAARVARRRTASDPFLRRADVAGPEQKPPSVPAPAEAAPAEPGTVHMAQGGRQAGGELAAGKTPGETVAAASTADLGDTVEEATALLPPRLPSFPELPPVPLFGGRAPALSSPSLSLPVGSETLGNSVAPWGYASSPPGPRRGKPLALAASATTVVFVVIALVMAFTKGGAAKNGAVAAARPASAGLVAPAEPASSPANAPAPTTSASAAAAAGPGIIESARR